MAEIREITSGLLYPEGPVAVDDGRALGLARLVS